MEKYDHHEIEAKWQKYWADKNIYKTDLDGGLLPFYNLMMFPYPSAEGLHIGGMYTFTGVDTYGRFKRMKGHTVFEPMGLDAFGIHSENYAIKIGEHIRSVSQRTEKHFYEQMHMMGNMFDWEHKLETNKEEYYKWTQWLFTQFFKAGLAYRKEAVVKFCPGCKTVLSDEQVIDGKCERCSSEVTDRDLEQWFFKITKYADRLYENLKKIEWDQDVKLGQKNWINKKTGINISYDVDGLEEKIVCFTTRPDTNFGATFVVLAPEHNFVKKIINGEIKVDSQTRDAINKYVNEVKSKSEIERIAEGKEKTGVFTGFYCINQLNKKKMAVWISDFVLGHFGTGAVVGVPGHDLRDFEFAQKFGIEIIRVVVGSDGDKSPITRKGQVQEDEGKMINSGFLDGMDIHEATIKIIDYIASKGWGEKVMNYNLRDWCVSRQRYWGPPIPMIHCEECAKAGKSWFTENRADAKKILSDNDIDKLIQEMRGWYPDENLPVKLPEIESFEAIKPDGSGRGPLASQPEFVKATCPACGAQAKRETDVSDPFVDSCWYFLRYPFTDFQEIPFGGDFDNPKSLYKPTISAERMAEAKNRMKKWGPVNSYIGGKEHTVLHLLYARFITMAFYDMGYIDFEEPFTTFYGHGLITKDGAKMSKSKGNVVNPDEYIEKYGADSIRLYLRFIGPFDQAGDWRDTGMDGMFRFVKKLWKIFSEDLEDKAYKPTSELNDESMIHKTIKEVGEDLETLRYNTAVALIMEYVNWYQANKENFAYDFRVKCLTTLALILAPLAPHIADEFWSILGHNTSIHLEKWPSFDDAKTVANKINVAIQVNGKFRGMVEIIKGTKQEDVEREARLVPNIKKYLDGDVVKVIFVPDKVVNFIVKQV